MNTTVSESQHASFVKNLDILDYMMKSGKITSEDVSKANSKIIEEVLEMEKVTIPKIMSRTKGSIQQYYINVPSCYSKTGQRHQLVCKTESEVINEFKKEAYATITRQTNQEEIEKITVQEIVCKFIKDSSIQETSRSKYYGLYKKYVKSSDFGFLRLCNLKYWHCEEFIGAIQGSATYNTLLQVKSVVKQSFDYAISRDMILRNYMTGVKININLCKKSERNTERIFSKDEIKSLEDACKKAWKEKKFRNSVVFFCQLFTGLRIGELLALQWENVDFENGLIRIVEGRKEYMDYINHKKVRINGVVKNQQSLRTIRLNDNAMYWFRELKRRNVNIDSNYVVTTKNGNIPNYNGIYATIKKFFDYAMIEYGGTHICRKTNISMRIASGDNPVNVSKDAGHKKLTTTLNVYNKYQDIEESVKKQNEIFDF